jgi:hypothetical protein
MPFERRPHRDQSQPDQGDDCEPVPATAAVDLQIMGLSAWDQEARAAEASGTLNSTGSLR